MATTLSPEGTATASCCADADIEIFAGAGGMTLGLQNAGFNFSHLIEMDPHTCATLECNHSSKGGLLGGEVHLEDVTKLNWEDFDTPTRLLAGGVPCQPFSLAGRHLADRDDRNLFPEVLRAVRSLRPQAVILENVQGLARPSFRPYLQYITRQLASPSVSPKQDEDWQDHDKRLRQHQETATEEREYCVNWALLQAADYGVAQTRRRVFIVATNASSIGSFEFPLASHRKELLMRNQANGDYWRIRHLDPPGNLPESWGTSDLDSFAGFNPWRTVRDAISDLPPPAASESECDNSHWYIPGAKLYRGHTGSPLDWPSKTIKAGVHGVPGGENVVLLEDGTHRYFTLRETARLQGFPDDYLFCGARLHVTRQIGNAVPVDLAEAIGRKLLRQMHGSTEKNSTVELTDG